MSENNEAWIIEGGTLTEYRGHDADVVIPSNVRTIAADAFAMNTEMRTLVIPDTVTGIDCTIDVNPYSRQTNLKTTPFCGCSRLVEVSVPAELLELLPGNGGLQYLFPDSHIETLTFTGRGMIKKFALSGLRDILKIVIKQGIYGIGLAAFQLQTKLASVEIPESVSVLEDQVFKGCPSLREIRFPGELNTVGAQVFAADRCEVHFKNKRGFFDKGNPVGWANGWQNDFLGKAFWNGK